MRSGDSSRKQIFCHIKMRNKIKHRLKTCFNPSIFSLPAQGRGLGSLPGLWLCRVVLAKDVSRQVGQQGPYKLRVSSQEGISESRGQVSASETEQWSGKQYKEKSIEVGLGFQTSQAAGAGGGHKSEEKRIIEREERPNLRWYLRSAENEPRAK